MLKKGEVVDLEIESAAFGGKGVAKHEGLAVFVAGTAPGDKIRARIIRRKKNYREAKILEFLEPSPDRIDPLCSHASSCGGCTWQHIPYNQQLQIKEQQVKDLISRIGGLDSSLVLPIIGCDKEFYYRNKMEYSFGTRRWLTENEIQKDEYIDDSGFSAGLHAPGRFDKILNLNECHLQDPISFRILNHVRKYCIENKIPAYDSKSSEGFMRHLMIRTSHNYEDVMVNLVTNADKPGLMNKISTSLIESFPAITTIVNNINDKPNPTAIGRFEHILYGPGTIYDSIGNHRFNIHANAFFQTNTHQAEKLYEIAAEFATTKENTLLYDLYCGVGTLSLFMSKRYKKIVGIEVVEVAIENARINARDNQVDNTEFLLGDTKDLFTESLFRETGMPDCIITDPPRSGMHPDVIQQLKNIQIDRIVYVSCNPSTLARDLKELKETYNIDKIRPVDMFPQTYHIEAVAQLSLKSG